MPDVKPLILGTKDDIAVLALSPGSQYQIFASAVDNVGNRRSLEEDMQNFVTIDFPGVVCLNNCSERGVCTEFSTCRCDPGYYGSDCSEGKGDDSLRKFDVYCTSCLHPTGTLISDHTYPWLQLIQG